MAPTLTSKTHSRLALAAHSSSTPTLRESLPSALKSPGRLHRTSGSTNLSEASAPAPQPRSGESTDLVLQDTAASSLRSAYRCMSCFAWALPSPRPQSRRIAGRPALPFSETRPPAPPRRIPIASLLLTQSHSRADCACLHGRRKSSSANSDDCSRALARQGTVPGFGLSSSSGGPSRPHARWSSRRGSPP